MEIELEPPKTRLTNTHKIERKTKRRKYNKLTEILSSTYKVRAYDALAWYNLSVRRERARYLLF
jgi:hypothetical protein